jgi:hypothetical protein
MVVQADEPVPDDTSDVSQPPGEPPATPPEDAVAAWEERSAEASRDLFASLQAGWLRGRDEDEGPADGMEGRT